MEIAIAAHSFEPARDGTARNASLIARSLLARGHSITVLTHSHPGPENEATPGLKVLRFRPRRFRWWTLPHREYRKAFRALHADAVILIHQDTWVSNQVIDLWPRTSGVRIYVPVEFHPLQSKGFTSAWGHRFWNDAVNRRLLEASDVVIASTPQEESDLRKFLGLKAPVRFLPHGLDESWFAPRGETRSAAPGDLPTVPFVLHVSTSAHHKRRDLAVALAQRMEPGVPWVFVGPGSENLTGVAHALGPVTDAQLRVLYASAALHVQTSRVEGFGFTLLEAMAQGTPFVAGPVGIAPDLARKGGGVVVPEPADASREEILDAFEAGAREALGRSWDRAAITRIARSYTAPEFAMALEGFIIETQEGKSGRRRTANR